MFKTLLLPPGLVIFLGIVLMILLRRRPVAAWWAGLVSLLLLYGFSTPFFGDLLMARLEVFPPLAERALSGEPPPDGRPGAIVVLSADEDGGDEYGGKTVGPLTLVRLRYGVYLYRRTHLPVLVSGGRLFSPRISLAEEMRQVMADEFGVPDVWVEDRSSNTWQNAVFSAAILKAKGIGRVYLVTHAWHMARARKAFARAGIAVIPAPTGFAGNRTVNAASFLPSARALLKSYYAIHELIGGIAYDLMYGDGTA